MTTAMAQAPVPVFVWIGLGILFIAYVWNMVWYWRSGRKAKNAP